METMRFLAWAARAWPGLGWPLLAGLMLAGGLWGQAAGTRVLGGQATAPGINWTGYRVGPPPGTVEVGADGSFTGYTVSATELEVVWVFGEVNQPALLAVVRPEATAIAVDAATTAEALFFLTPPGRTVDPEVWAETREKLSGLASFAALTARLGADLAAGKDWAEDARVEALMAEVLVDYGKLPTTTTDLLQAASSYNPEAFEPGTPARVWLRVLNPQPFGFDQSRLKSTVKRTDVAFYDWKVESFSDDRPNLLDQVLQVYSLSPGQFSGGLDAIDSLAGNQTLNLGNPPVRVFRGYTRAQLRSAKLDLAATIADKVYARFVSSPDRTATFAIGREENAVYLLQATSGNVWYGTTLLDPARSQDFVLDANDPDKTWTQALAMNMVIAAIDGASVFNPKIKAIGEKLSDFVVPLTFDLTKTLTSFQATGTELRAGQVAEIISTLVKAILKYALNTDFEIGQAEDAGIFKRFLGKVNKVVSTVLGPFGQVSSGLQAVERSANLLAPTHLALERSILVVGDPFGPRIRSFGPQEARAEEIMVISGENFPSTSNAKVYFRNFLSTGTPPTPSGQVEGTILAGNSTSMIVRLPSYPAWQAVFGNTWTATVTIDNISNQSSGTTLNNDEPNDVFRMVPPPVLTAVEPESASRGQLVRLKATGLREFGEGTFYYFVDGLGYGRGQVNTPDEIVFSTDSLLAGAHTVALGAPTGAAFTNALPFTVTDPSIPQQTPQGLPPGLVIRYTLANYSNAPDGKISVYEALALAAGTLGRPVQQRPQEPPPGVEYESDYIDNLEYYPAGGVLSRDTVVAGSGFTAEVMNDTGIPLPLAGGDDIRLSGIVFDGTNAGPTASGLVFDGTSGTVLNGGTWKNYGGNGVVFKNGAKDNRVDNITVEAAGGHGILFEGMAGNNSLFAPKILNAGIDGIHAEGAGVVGNRIASASSPPLFGGELAFVTITAPGRHGVYVGGGAKFNGLDCGHLSNAGDIAILVTGEGTEGNQIGAHGFYLQINRRISGSMKQGLVVEQGARSNVFRHLAIYGITTGDAVVLDNADYNYFPNLVIGFDPTDSNIPVSVRNAGNGLVVKNGSTGNIFGGLAENYFDTEVVVGSNDGNGIVIEGEGTDRNLVSAASIGWHNNVRGQNDALGHNGGHGIVVRGGAKHTVIGDANEEFGVLIDGTPNGVGILIEGAGTDGTVVTGVRIGMNGDSPVDVPNWAVQDGIVVRDGPRGSRIGIQGDRVVKSSFEIWSRGITVGYTKGVGLLLDNLQATLAEDGSLVGSNVVMNVRMNTTTFGGSGPARRPWNGLVIQGNTQGQILGAKNQAGGSNNTFAGRNYAVLMQNNVIAMPELRNRFYGNWFSNAGDGSGAGADPLAGPVNGTAVVIVGGSGNVLGEQLVGDYNLMGSARVGIYLDGGMGNIVRGTRIANNPFAGVLVRGGAGHRIGDPRPDYGNLFFLTGTVGNDATAAVILSGGSGHVVEGNTFGLPPFNGDYADKSHAILVKDSANALIGGPTELAGNVIGRPQGHGIVLEGAGTTGAKVWNNFIGLDRGNAQWGGKGNGILVRNGAANATLGGTAPFTPPGGGAAVQIPASNQIANNLLAGIAVEGASTLGNRISHNAIADNGGLGIDLSNGGNADLPKPFDLAYDGFALSGKVDGAQVPTGSVVEVFADATGLDPEAWSWVGETTVKADGTWSLPAAMPPGGRIFTATVTHKDTGSTSEIGFVTPAPENPLVGLRAAAVPLAPGAANLEFAPGWIPVLALDWTALEAVVEVQELTLALEGTLPDDLAFTQAALFRDGDRDGQITDFDAMLDAAVPVAADNPSLLFTPGTLVRTERPERWLLAVKADPLAFAGGTLQAKLTAATAAKVDFRTPLGYTGALLGAFPLVSDAWTAQFGEPLSFEEWQARFWSGEDLENPKVSGPNADPDRDGLTNRMEHALGTDPMDAASRLHLQTVRANGVTKFSYRKSKNPTEAVLRAEVSTDMITWVPAQTAATGVDTVDEMNGFERIDFRFETGQILFFRLVVE